MAGKPNCFESLIMFSICFFPGFVHAVKAFVFCATRGCFSSSRKSYSLFESSLRLHRYSQASSIASIARRRWPEATDIASMQCTLALKAGELPEAFALLQRCLSVSDCRAVDRVLFRTGSRPRDLQQSGEVFRFLSRHAEVDSTRRAYALVAEAYLVIRLNDAGRAQELIEDLEGVIEKLDCDEAITRCPLSNRQNLGKLYVSIGSALYHLALLRGDMPLLVRCWRRLSQFSRAIDRNQMNADALHRMSSNLGRGLALGFLLDPSQHGRVRTDALALLKDWTTANASEFAARRHIKGKTPQENHLLFLEALQDSCEELHQAGGSVAQQVCRHWARLLNHSSDRNLTDTITVLVQRQLMEPER